MKKLFASSILLLSLAAVAQKTPAKPAPKKPAAVTTSGTLKNKVDSISYAIGLNVADFYAQQGIKNLNPALVSKAIADVTANKKRLLNEAEANMALMCFSKPELCANVQSGEKFLAVNKNKAGVKTTASGLQYEVITMGSGAKPTAADTVTVNYAGTLINGQEFDNSYKRGEPISFPLNGVIRGWTEALQLMPVGSKFKIYLPYQLGYGMNDMGPSIPGGSVLIFEVELLGIKPAKS